MNRQLWLQKRRASSHTEQRDDLTIDNLGTEPGNIASQIRSQMEQLALNLTHIMRNSYEWKIKAQIDAQLANYIHKLAYVNHLYVINSEGVQVSNTYFDVGTHTQFDVGRNRAMRPYVRQLSLGDSYTLSGVYINQGAGEPAVTVMQRITDHRSALLGYLCAELFIRHIPHLNSIFDEPPRWQQLKGDPAIRSQLFQQRRNESLLDQHIDLVIDQLEGLICFHGLFQLNLHFSSSRATVWFIDSPLHYRLLDHKVLTDPELSFIYPPTDYSTDSHIAQSDIRPLLEILKQLRLQDEVVYLRSASLNLFNGLVSLTFSCDGTHYIPYGDLLNPDHKFWKQAS